MHPSKFWKKKRASKSFFFSFVAIQTYVTIKTKNWKNRLKYNASNQILYLAKWHKLENFAMYDVLVGSKRRNLFSAPRRNLSLVFPCFITSYDNKVSSLQKPARLIDGPATHPVLNLEKPKMLIPLYASWGLTEKRKSVESMKTFESQKRPA